MVATLVGGIVAKAARGREMIAPIPLGLVLGALGGAASFVWVASEGWLVSLQAAMDSR